MNLDQIRIVHQALAEDQWIDAANLALRADEIEYVVQDKKEASTIIRKLLQNLVIEGDYLLASALCLPREMFVQGPESVGRIFRSIHEHDKLLVMGSSSVSKCLGRDTGVIMFDGRIKKVQDVMEGDLLMGDDSTPRRVLKTGRGIGPLYRVIPERGDAWVCNDAHILTLRCTLDRKCGSGAMSNKWRKNRVFDVPVTEFAAYSETMRTMLKQFHVGIELPAQSVPFDPYVYGAWLGDGGFDVPALHKPDGPVAQYWCKYFSEMGYRIHAGYVGSESCPMWCVRMKDSETTNSFTAFIRTSRKDNYKIILDNYLYNSRENRLRLLAGLMDTDGWSNDTQFGFSCKERYFADQVCWLARSLGFNAYLRPFKGEIKSIGFIGWYWSIYISGEGITEIPTIQKKIRESTTKKRLTNVGIRVEPIGEGEYFGFILDGNHRFLLEDFTVTHNTYSIVVYNYLDWLIDPFYTSVKLTSQSEAHMQGNVWSHLMDVHEASVIKPEQPVQIISTDLWMGIKGRPMAYGFKGIAFKQAILSTGTWSGFKPQPKRPKTDPLYPIYGPMTRLRVMVDEGQFVHLSAWDGLNSVMGSMGGGRVKVMAAFNPVAIDAYVVQQAEPVDGWSMDQLETLYSYESKFGWHVERLDAAKSENVVTRKDLYPGFMTYKAYIAYLQGAGDGSARYFIYARGFPPLRDAVNTIVPADWLHTQRGEAVYIDKVQHVASADLAFQGADKAVLVVGRWGLAAAWRRFNNETVFFMDRANPGERKARHVLTVDQIFILPKSNDTVSMVQELIGRCKQLRIKPEDSAMDKTGNALGVYSHASRFWGDVLGIGWGEKATDKRVLTDDLGSAQDSYDGVVSEMWFSFSRWLDPLVNAIVINTTVPTTPLFNQLTSRRFKYVKAQMVRVESKDEYKARNGGQSPDEADALIQLIHLLRVRGKVLPGIMEGSGESNKDTHGKSTDLENIDKPDTLDTGSDHARDSIDLEVME